VLFFQNRTYDAQGYSTGQRVLIFFYVLFSRTLKSSRVREDSFRKERKEKERERDGKGKEGKGKEREKEKEKERKGKGKEVKKTYSSINLNHVDVSYFYL